MLKALSQIEYFLMKYPLVIITRAIGTPSETFIKRHINDLLPGKTAVIADYALAKSKATWAAECHKLVLYPSIYGSLPIIKKIINRFQKTGVGRYITSYRVVNFLKKHQVEVILLEYLDRKLEWIPLFKKLNIRYYPHAHGYDVSSQLQKKYWKTNYLKHKAADEIITMNLPSVERLVEIGLDRSQIYTIHYGINVPDKIPDRNNKEIINCLSVGRLTAKKAPLLLLESFKHAYSSFPNLKLHIIGDGILRKNIEEYIKQNKLQDIVTLYGSQPNNFVLELMDKSDIYLQHSLTDPETGDEEGLPVSILEAMAHGLPVISTLHSGIPEEVVHGQTGFLVKEGDIVSMGEYIITLANDPELRKLMGFKGWQRAKNEFSWEQERMKLLEVMKLTQYL